VEEEKHPIAMEVEIFGENFEVDHLLKRSFGHE